MRRCGCQDSLSQVLGFGGDPFYREHRGALRGLGSGWFPRTSWPLFAVCSADALRRILVVLVVGILIWLWSPGSLPGVGLRVGCFPLAEWSMGFVWTLWLGAHVGRVGFQAMGHGGPFLTADPQNRFVLGAPKGSGRRA